MWVLTGDSAAVDAIIKRPGRSDPSERTLQFFSSEEDLPAVECSQGFQGAVRVLCHG